MTIRTSTAFANLQLGNAGPTTQGTLDGALGYGILMLYSGAQPVSADNAATGTLLAVVTLNGGAFTDGVTTGGNGLLLGKPSTWTAASRSIGIPAGALWATTAGSTGTIGWARFRGNAADPMTNDTYFVYPRMDFSVGVTSGDIQISAINVVGTGFTGYQGNAGGTYLTVTGVNITV